MQEIVGMAEVFLFPWVLLVRMIENNRKQICVANGRFIVSRCFLSATAQRNTA